MEVCNSYSFISHLLCPIRWDDTESHTKKDEVKKGLSLTFRKDYKEVMERNSLLLTYSTWSFLKTLHKLGTQ